MNQDEFMRLLGEGGSSSKGKAGKVDWDALIVEARTSGDSYTITNFHKKVVKGAVSRGRTGGKLNDLFTAKKVARLIRNDGAYVYCFAAEAIKIQHGE